MCLTLEGRLVIAVPVHAWRPPTRGIHGESTKMAIVSFYSILVDMCRLDGDGV